MTIVSPYGLTPFSTCRVCGAEMADGSRSLRQCQGCADAATLARMPLARRKLDRLTPARYRWATREAPELAARVQPVSAIARAFAARTSLSLVLSGPAGAGKTALARAVWFERALARIDCVRRDDFIATWQEEDSFHVRALFATAHDLAKARREHRLGDGEAPLVDDAMTVDLLLLDELGADSTRGDDAVGEVVHQRHAHERPTIYTTAFSLDELAERHGDGVARRVFEGATVITLGSVKR
jgi:DNA replication protein DnaC